jgi:hypothetical protein
MAEGVDIKQIKIGDDLHYIDAKKWNGHEFSEITNALHGVVDTFVIPTTKSSVSNYNTIVSNTSNTMETSKTTLDTLVATKSSGGYKIGDIVLLEKQDAFDRWISKIDGNKVYLTVLETQVATHHHTLSVSGDTKALTDVANTTPTELAKAGTAVSVVTGVTGNYGVLTSAVFSCNGTHDIKLYSVGYSDANAIAHSHVVTIPTFESTVSAYTTLMSDTFKTHTHTTTSVAGLPENGSEITYVTSANSTQSFVTGISINSTNTGSALTATGAVATSTSDVGTGVLTTSSGDHTHGVTVDTGGKVVTSVRLASSVVTSVSYSAPTGSTVISWKCVVNGSGVLSFESPIENRVKSVTLNAPRTNQSTEKDSAITLSGTAASAGAHSHGFSHTHSITAHTHKYDKSTAAGLVKGITSLSTNSFTPHTHKNGVSAYTGTTESTTITYLKGDADSVGKSSVLTNTKTYVSVKTSKAYLMVSGTVNFSSSLTTSCVSLSTMLSTSSIKPAVTATASEQGIKSITFNSKNFITSINSKKTGGNKGGL